MMDEHFEHFAAARIQEGVPPPRRRALGASEATDVEATWIERVVASRPVRSGYASVIAHVLVALVLAALMRDSPRPARNRPIVIRSGEAAADERATAGVEAVVRAEAEASGEGGESEAASDGSAAPDDGAQAAEATADIRPDDVETTPATSVSLVHPVASSSAGIATADLEVVTAEPEKADPGAKGRRTSLGITGRPFADRRGEARGEAVRTRGGSGASEAAVERGLAWLATHQCPDGSWRCDLSGCRCDGACRDPGSVSSTTASTAIALLPFLGAGSTHRDGPYRETVSRGIYYLASRMTPTPRGGDLCEGTMYGQGLATLVFTEALGMTGDDLLRGLAADAIRFIETAQDQYGGGWRYLPGQPGDMTVTAWQIAALKSGGIAGLAIPSPTLEGAGRFLDRVQSMRGAAYGYRSPSAKTTTSAIGLLCRMYLGSLPDDEPIARGITRLAARGPQPDAVYENFYLAQALLQAGHPAWPRWNTRNRDELVRRQEAIGHEAGSWFFADPETAAGGRLAHTALAVLTLEVYYRLLPIYGEQAVGGRLD